MFNIQENENETTGNFVAVDMNQRNEVPHDRPKLALKEQGSIKLARKNSNLKRSTAQGFNRQTSYKSSKFGLGDQEKRTSGYNDSSSSQDNNLFSNQRNSNAKMASNLRMGISNTSATNQSSQDKDSTNTPNRSIIEPRDMNFNQMSSSNNIHHVNLRSHNQSPSTAAMASHQTNDPHLSKQKTMKKKKKLKSKESHIDQDIEINEKNTKQSRV